MKIPKIPKFKKVSKLPKLKKQKVKKTNGTKKYANPIFDGWKAAAVADLANKNARSLVIRECILCFAFLCVIVASSVFTGYYVSSREQEVRKVLNRGNGLLNEYGKIIKDLETYERYADMKLKVSLYIQFAALTSSSKMGFFIDALSFEQEASLGNLKEPFIVETGQSADAIKVLGAWKMKGLLMQEADNRWALSFKNSLESMFSLFGMKSYVSASLRGSDLEATVVLYE